MNFVVVVIAFAFLFFFSVSASPYYSRPEQVDIDFAALQAPASPTDRFNFTLNGNMSNVYVVRVTDVTPDNRTRLQFDNAVGISAANAANRTGTVLLIEVIDMVNDGMKRDGFSPIEEFFVAEIAVAPAFGRDVLVRFNPHWSTFNLTSTRSMFDPNRRAMNVTFNAPLGQPVVLASMKVVKKVWVYIQPDYNKRYRDEAEYIGIIVGSVIGAILFVVIIVGVAIFIVRRRAAAVTMS
jgi:hypothetical protein